MKQRFNIRWSFSLALFVCACDPAGTDAEAATAATERVAESPPLRPPAQFDLQLDNYVGTWGHRWPAFRFHGVVSVAVEDEVVAERAYGFADLASQTENATDTPIRIGTLSVHLAIATTLSLAQDGILNLDDPVSRWLPDTKLATSVTVEHLLTHTSGIPSFTQSLGFAMSRLRSDDHRGLVLASTEEALEFEPGTSFAASSTNGALLGLVVERASGRGFSAAARERVLAPLQMQDTTWGTLEASTPAGLQFDEAEHLVAVRGVDPRILGAAGAWTSTAADLQRFYTALVRGQFGDGADLERLFGANPFEQAYGFVEGILGGHRSFLWLGLIDGHNSAVLLVPDQAVSIVVLGNAEVVPASSIAADVAGILYGFQTKPRVEARDIPVAAKDLEPLAGVWRMTARSRDEFVNAARPELFDQIVQVELEWHRGDEELRGMLLLARAGAPKKRLHPAGPRQFFFKDLPQSTARTGMTSTGVRTLTLARDGVELHYRQLASRSR